jgi:hypothetical protein
MEAVMNTLKSSLLAVTAITPVLLVSHSEAAPLPTHIAAMKSMLDKDTLQVRWGGWGGGWRGGGWGYRGWGYRGGWGGRGWGRPLGAAAAGAIVGGAIASSAYYGGYPYYGGDPYYAGYPDYCGPYDCGGYGYGYGYGGYPYYPPRRYGW